MNRPLSLRTAQRCREDAADSPLSDPSVDYPPWYLTRWHFLPEGYLSRRSGAWYDAVIRRVYWAGHEAPVLRHIASGLRREQASSVVELGCGAGTGLAALGEALPGASLAGVDLSPFLLELSRDRTAAIADRVRLIHACATGLPFADSSVDAVVAFHVLGHVPAEVARSLVAEARRVLRPAGSLSVVDHAWHTSLPARPALVRRFAAGTLALRQYRPSALL